jgi:hypothetical protein
LLLSQLLPLLSGGFLQRAGGQPLRGSVSHLLHLGKIHVESRALLAKGVAYDNFSPLLGEPGDGLQFLGSELPCCHDIAIHEVREIRQAEYPSAYPTRLPLRSKGCPALVPKGRRLAALFEEWQDGMMAEKERTMIELTPEQTRAIAAQEAPIHLLNPATQEVFVLIRKDVYDLTCSVVGSGTGQVWTDEADDDLILRKSS